MGVLSVVTTVGILIVLAISIFIGYPHRELDIDNVVVPMMYQYSGQTIEKDDRMKLQHQPLQGTVILITGATSGIGLSLTRFVCHYGATVIALGRSNDKLTSLRKEYPNNVRTFRVDQSDLRSVANVANEIRASNIDAIHIMVNNAGMHAGYFTQFYDTTYASASHPELDNVFVVNYLSHVLLTEKLYDLLQPNNNKAPRIVQISSSYHRAANGIDLLPDPLVLAANGTKVMFEPPLASQPIQYASHAFFRGHTSYYNTKLAQIYHSRALRLKAKNIRIVNVCPAWVGTEIGRADDNSGDLLKLLAFPVNGWGISSSLHAMFRDDNNANNDSDELSRMENDYIGNAKFNVFRFFPKNVPNVILRDMIVFLMAASFLWVQKLSAETSYERSSEVSYNTTIAVDLYDWSLQTIAPYLK